MLMGLCGTCPVEMSSEDPLGLLLLRSLMGVGVGGPSSSSTFLLHCCLLLQGCLPANSLYVWGLVKQSKFIQLFQCAVNAGEILVSLSHHTTSCLLSSVFFSFVHICPPLFKGENWLTCCLSKWPTTA